MHKVSLHQTYIFISQNSQDLYYRLNFWSSIDKAFDQRDQPSMPEDRVKNFPTLTFDRSLVSDYVGKTLISSYLNQDVLL